LAGGAGRQVSLDTARGSGLQITLDPLSRVPTGKQFLAESRDYFAGQKIKVLRAEEPARLRGAAGELGHFAIDVEIKTDRVVMDYYVARQDNGGATLAARLPPGDDRADLLREVERIAKSVTITKPIK